MTNDGLVTIFESKHEKNATRPSMPSGTSSGPFPENENDDRRRF